MERFKIDLFEKEHNRRFPRYSELTKEKCLEIQSTIAIKYNISSGNLNSELELQRQYHTGALSDNFELMSELMIAGINPSKYIYLNWHNFEKIDRFYLSDLNRYFYDIWFPVADDLDLFDETLDWILSIRHDGYFSFIKSSTS